MNVWDDTSPGDGSLDQCIEFLISSNGKLQVPRCDTLHFKILACVPGQFEHLSRQVLQNSRCVHGGGGTDALTLLDGALKESVNSANGELSFGGERERERVGCGDE